MQKKVEEGFFIDIFKLYGMGIIFGIVINLFVSFINSFFVGIAHPVLIIVKLFLSYSIFFSALYLLSYYFIINYFTETGSSLNWVSNFMFNLSFLGGIFSFLNIIQVLNMETPQTIFFYFSYISFILFISLVLGFFTTHFFDAVFLKDKILFFIINFLILSLLLVSYFFTVFYNLIFSYLIVVLFGVLVTIFYFSEFKYFLLKKKRS